MATDWTDPCQRFAALSLAYYQLISGVNPASVEYSANGVARKVTYSFANIDALRRQMLASQDACDIATGARRTARRHAIGAGSRRTGWYGHNEEEWPI
jgi:hypothetical protein